MEKLLWFGAGWLVARFLWMPAQVPATNPGGNTYIGPPVSAPGVTVVNTVTNSDGSVTTTYSDGSSVITPAPVTQPTNSNPLLNINPHPGFRQISISPSPLMSGRNRAVGGV